MMFKAIDTEYGGILYRSRLEARWAQFFDKAEIRHKYELSKIDLGIDKYTPDFWFPDFKLWAEDQTVPTVQSAFKMLQVSHRNALASLVDSGQSRTPCRRYVRPKCASQICVSHSR